ncbi:MAG: hypothetical protein AVDCRST_MAG49-380 [uncultured Thermomicrobiales bacterium]|uniref:Uncharacterized protein n=1 Tax=uncultured Thermomicrobiales bacterium TaxID=1645740 RepID=A0A6J4TYF2_9BACT|nr:MAG: hypothetical protein AVDCRST_MAG49-380 [uncultured Thermomicrobiales bacterium]
MDILRGLLEAGLLIAFLILVVGLAAALLMIVFGIAIGIDDNP